MILADTSVWIDMHLLQSARLSAIPLWTMDKQLRTAAEEFDLVP